MSGGDETFPGIIFFVLNGVIGKILRMNCIFLKYLVLHVINKAGVSCARVWITSDTICLFIPV